jgi:hypothetical protein
MMTPRNRFLVETAANAFLLTALRAIPRKSPSSAQQQPEQRARAEELPRAAATPRASSRKDESDVA